MDWVMFGAQWLHILLGILWFGNSLALATITIPAINRLPILAQREIGSHLNFQSQRVFQIVAPSVIVLGFIRGTLLGPIKDLDALFGTAYGLTWLIALVAAVLTYLWGRFAIGGGIRAMELAPINPDGTATPELVAATDRVKIIASLELVGFLVIFTCMILMRFGQ
jgi:uncharacterized membrane protein